MLCCVGDLESDVESPRAVAVSMGIASLVGVVIVGIGTEVRAEGEVVVEVVTG